MKSLDAWGIVANVANADRALRMGAKVWLGLHTGGMGEDEVGVWGMSRGGRNIEKIVTTMRLDKFRAAWVPLHLRQITLCRQFESRADAQAMADQYQRHVDAKRARRASRTAPT